MSRRGQPSFQASGQGTSGGTSGGAECSRRRCAQSDRSLEEGLPTADVGCSATARPPSFELVPSLGLELGPSPSDINFLPCVSWEPLVSLHVVTASVRVLGLWAGISEPQPHCRRLPRVPTGGLAHLSSGRCWAGTLPQLSELQHLGEGRRCSADRKKG